MVQTFSLKTSSPQHLLGWDRNYKATCKHDEAFCSIQSRYEQEGKTSPDSVYVIENLFIPEENL